MIEHKRFYSTPSPSVRPPAGSGASRLTHFNNSSIILEICWKAIVNIFVLFIYLSSYFLAGTAKAANVALGTSLSGAGASWFSFGNYAQGFGFGDASTSYGGDAFDIAGILTVNGLAYTNPDADVDVTGNTLTTDASTLNGITVYLQYTAMTSTQTLRTLVSLTNSTGSALSRSISYQMNWGSDGGTLVRETSSGDTSFTVGDRWSVTSDAIDSDPVNLTVWRDSAGGGVMPTSVSTTVFDAAGTQGLALNYDININAYQTMYLMFFHDLFDATTQAVSGGLSIYNAPLSGERLQGIPTQGIQNFTAVPEPTIPLLGALTLVCLIKRRRRMP